MKDDFTKAEKEMIIKKFFEKRERLADLINGLYYHGEPVYTKEDLENYHLEVVVGNGCLGIQLIPKSLN